MFSKVLVANRGEIAVRVIRALEELGIATVAVYSELDRDALHVAARRRGLPARPRAGGRELPERRQDPRGRAQVGRRGDPPGYGFLAENAAFARACEEAGIMFIGPPAAGDRGDGLEDPRPRADGGGRRADRARHHRAGRDASRTRAGDRRARSATRSRSRRPAAGGGKGFRVALAEDELEEAFEGAAREGEKFFGDATVYLERYLPDPRHVEVQVLADAHGSVVHLGERDCSIQRRHQKLIEESPGARRWTTRCASASGRSPSTPRGRSATAARARSRACWPGRRVLLPGDEHPRPGRALRHRDGDGHRHRARADPDRRGRAALVRAGGRRAARARDRVPHQRRGRRQELRARPGADRRATASPRARACASTPAWGRARRSRPCTTRWWPS